VAGDKAAAARKLRAWLTQDIVPAGLFQGQGSAGEAAPLPQASGADLKPVEFAEAFVRGSQVDWRAVSQGRKYRRVALPGYPFQRERYWIDSPRANFPSAAFPAPAPLLGTRLHVAGVLAQFQTELQVGGSTAWIGQHVMDGRTVFPLSAHLELALEAAAQLLGPGATVEDLILRSPLVVDQACTVQVVVGHQVDGRHLLRVYAAQTNHEWTSVSECRLRPSPDAGAARPAQELLDGASLRARLAEDSDVAGFYARMAAGGAAFGPKFQGLTRIWSGPGEAMGEVNSPGAGEGYIFAPWQLDACLQLIGCVRGDQDLYLPSSVGGIGVYGTPGARCWSHLQCRRVDNDTLSADVTIARDDETVIAVIREIIFRKLAVKKNDASSLFYRLRWHPDAASSPASNVRPIQKAILLGSSPRIPGIAAELRAHGVTVQLLPPDAHRDTVSISPDTDAVLCFSSPSDRVGEDRVGEDRVGEDRVGEDRVGEELLPGQVARRMEKNVRLVLAAAQAMLRSEAAAAPRLYVITRDACPAIDDSPEPVHLNHTPLVGMANAIAIEAPELRCTLIDDTSGDPGTPAPSLAGEILAGREDQRVAFRAGVRYTARLERVPSSEMPATDSESAALTLATGIEALSYKTRERPEPGPDEVEIAVRATALNFRDVLKATGLLDHAGSVGTDCAGVISRVGSQVSGLRSGDPVVAIAPGCFADYVVTPASLVVRKPARLSFESAAAQTVAYLTADYCLHELARVRKGERVLIHAAAGGVGLAAVHLCRQAGAEVIATAGSKAKRDWLRSLGIDHVFDSRSTAFRERIADGVFADGVDIVLNSLAGPAIDAGLATLRANGRFIELGKTDLRPVEEIRLRWPGITYIQADLTPLFNERSPWVAEHMTALLTAIEAAALPALPLTVFERAETRQAFRHMAAARHIGRVVIRSGPRDVSAGAHLITGGLGGIGLSLAEWLVAAGARDLVLAGRHGVSLESSRAIAKLEALGATVRVFQSDLADWDNARRLVAACGDALRGVWHCAGVIDDAILPEQSWVRFAGVLAPKTDGAWNLHLLTQASKLDFFVLFSSWASLAGSRGQANYCAANAFLDGLAAFRRAGGLPALSVNWGAWSHTGLASGEVVQRHLERSGMHAMQPELALAALGLALRMGEPGLAIALVDWPKYLAQIPPSQRGFYTDLLLESQNASPRAPSSGKQSPAHPESASDTLATNGRALLSLITSALPADRAATVQRVIEDVIRRTLALRSSDRIDPHESFSDLGMDSLLAVELRNSLSTILERRLPSAIVFDYPTVKKLARFVENELYPAQPAIAKPEYETRRNLEMESADALTPMSLLDQIEELSDEEVDSIFDDGSSGRFRLAK
jgi:NADPH:quinone reductase-like Zn-dependent oxidoreductase/acyl carrier protein